MLLETFPAAQVILIERLELCGVARDPLREARLEHEGHGAGELHGLELAVGRMLEGISVRAVRQHLLWSELPPGTKPSGLASYTP